MKKKSKSILAVVLAILLILVVAVSLTTNILFSRKDTPKIFGHYIYLMEYDTMEAGAAAVATGTTDLNAAGTVDSESAAASIHKHTAVIATAYQESDPIAKNNAAPYCSHEFEFSSLFSGIAAMQSRLTTKSLPQ